MVRTTTLHGTFKCRCGCRTCTVRTEFIRCERCGRLYSFWDYTSMLEKYYGQMLLEAGHGELAEGA